MNDSIMNAVIKSVDLRGDEGWLTAWINLEIADGGSQGFGGYGLYPNRTCACGLFIWRVLEVTGKPSWDKLPGTAVRVRGTRSRIDALGHFLKDQWFVPAEELGALG